MLQFKSTTREGDFCIKTLPAGHILNFFAERNEIAEFANSTQVFQKVSILLDTKECFVACPTKSEERDLIFNIRGEHASQVSFDICSTSKRNVSPLVGIVGMLFFAR